MQEGRQQAFIPWRVINALYEPIKERTLDKGEKECLDNNIFWEKTDLADLETYIMSIPLEFVVWEHVDNIDESEKEQEYESFLTHFRSLKEQQRTTRNIYNLLEHLDLYAQYLGEEEKNDRLAIICDEGIRIADELISTYQADNLLKAITTTLETKAKFCCAKGYSKPDREILQEGLGAVERLKKMNKERLTPHQYNIQGELLSYLATMHQGQGELQAMYIEQSMSCLEKALLDVINEDFLLNYSNLYTLVEDTYAIPHQKKTSFQKRAQDFMKHLQREHKDNEMINYYTDDLLDEDEDEGLF